MAFIFNILLYGAVLAFFGPLAAFLLFIVDFGLLGRSTDVYVDNRSVIYKSQYNIMENSSDTKKDEHYIN